MKSRKRNWRISVKLWMAMMLLIVVVLGSLTITITWLFGDFYLNQKLNELGNEAKDITNQLKSQQSWAERLSTLQNEKLSAGTQLIVLNCDGGLITVKGSISTASDFSSITGWRGGMGLSGTGMQGSSFWIHPLLLTDFFTQENMQEVLSGQTITIEALPSANKLGQAMLIAATPIGKPAEAVLLLGSSPAPVQESISTFRRMILYSTLLAVLLATLVALFFARQVSRPVVIMQKAASRMAKGDFQNITGINSRDEIGELVGVLNSMGQSLKNHMEWLSQERNLLEGIVEGMSDAVIMLDAEGQILYTNEPAKALWSEDEESASDRKKQIATFLQELLHSEGEGKIKNLSLGTQVLQVSIASTSARNGVEGYVAVLRDITASLRAEKERRDFMASVTHELRTPLHLIQGYLEAIQDGVIPQKDQPEQIEFVLDETRRLAKLVYELQEVNRLERWKTLELQTMDLEEFMQDLKYRYQSLAEEKGIELEIMPIQGEITADRDRLLQVFINLMDNAFRYTPQGKRIRVNSEREESVIRFSITDEGEGIPSQDLPHIFNRFYRVDKARSRKDGGMGLGLAIVKQIVEAHGGKIKAESQVGVGTQFIFTIPLKSEMIDPAESKT